MSDITVQILEGIRADIAAMDAKIDTLDTKLDGVEARLDQRIDALDHKIDALDHRLSHRLDQTNERLGSMVTLLGHFARREDDIDARLRALESHVFGSSEP